MTWHRGCGWAFLGLVLVSGLGAQSVFWTGGAATGNWGTAANWDSDPALPLTTDVVGFDAAAANGQFNLTLGANRTVAGVVFAATGSDAFAFGAGNTLAVGASGIVNNHALTQTFAAPVTAAATSTWSTTGGGLDFANVNLAANLTLTGAYAFNLSGTLTNTGGSRTLTQNATGALTLATVALSESNTARTLTISGTGNTTVTGAVTNGGTGAGNLTKTGTGTLTLESAGTYSGTTTLSAGTTVIGDDAAFGTSQLVLNGGTLSGDGTARTIANQVRLAGNSILGGASNLEFTGPLTLSADRSLTINNTGATLFGDVAISNSVTNRILTIAGTGDATIAGVISNGSSAASSLTKSGTGTLTLSGTNTYAGTTTLSGGTLAVAGDAAFGSSTLALGAGTIRGEGGARTIANSGTLIGNTTFGGAFDLTFTGTLTQTGSRTLTLANSGLTTFGAIDLSNTVTSRTLTFTGAGDARVTGVIGNGLSPASNLTKSGTGTLTLDGDNTYGGTTTLSGGTLVINGNNTTTGATTLTAGTLIVGSDTAFGSGNINFAAATLQGDGTPRTIGNTVSLTGNGTIGGASDLAFTGTVTQTASRTLTVNNSGLTTFNNLNLSASATSYTLTVTGTGDVRVDGVIANGGSSTAGRLTKAGTGTLTLAGVNTYGGITTVNGGTLRLGVDGALPTGAVVVNATAASSTALLDLAGYDQTITTLTFGGTGAAASSASNVATGAGTLTLGGTVTYAATNNPLGATLSGLVNLGGATRTFSVADSTGTATELAVTAAISGTGGLTKTGTGNLLLAGANSYSGDTTLSAGTLTVGHDSAFGAGTLILNAGTLQGDGTARAIGNAATLGGNITIAGASDLTLGGTLTQTANRTLTLTNSGLTRLGAVDLSSTTTNRTLTLAGTGNLVVDGVIGNGASTASNLTLSGTGTVTLNGANTYAGTTRINSGTLVIAAESALGANPATFAATRLTLNGGTLRTTATMTIDDANRGVTVLAPGGTLAAEGGTTLTIANAIAGAGQLTAAGPGTVTLGGTTANTFTGGLAVADGTVNLGKTAGVNAVGGGAVVVGDGVGAAQSASLVLQASNQLPDATAVTLAADGRLALGTFSESISTLAGTGLLDLGTAGSLILGADGGASLFSGSITGLGNLQVAALGELTLDQDNSFGGSLTLAGGRLVLSDSELTVGSLVITADSIIDFAGVGSSLSATSLIFSNTSITLTILNWNLATDFLYASIWAGAQRGYDNQGQLPMTQIVFNGWSAAETGWEEYSDRIRPNVPEPGTYGALLMAAGLGLLCWRRSGAGRRRS